MKARESRHGEEKANPKDIKKEDSKGEDVKSEAVKKKQSKAKSLTKWIQLEGQCQSSHSYDIKISLLISFFPSEAMGGSYPTPRRLVLHIASNARHTNHEGRKSSCRILVFHFN